MPFPILTYNIFPDTLVSSWALRLTGARKRSNKTEVVRSDLMRQILEIQFFLSNLFKFKSSMKRLAAVLVILGSLCFSFSSCKKCYSCDFGNGDVRKFCSKDFPDGNSGLQLTVKAYEQEGYTCTAQ
jgi:hypothetical protein